MHPSKHTHQPKFATEWKSRQQTAQTSASWNLRTEVPCHTILTWADWKCPVGFVDEAWTMSRNCMRWYKENARHFLLFLSHGRTIHSSLMQERKIHSVFVCMWRTFERNVLPACLHLWHQKGRSNSSFIPLLVPYNTFHGYTGAILCLEDIFFSAFCILQEQKRGLTTSAQCLCCISKKLFFKEQWFSQLNVH